MIISFCSGYTSGIDVQNCKFSIVAAPIFRDKILLSFPVFSCYFPLFLSVLFPAI